MIVFTVMLVGLALLISVLGGLLLSQATTGGGLLCAAFFLGILARIAQASEHHQEICELLKQPDAAPGPESGGKASLLTKLKERW
jgi:hypothetical protein